MDQAAARRGFARSIARARAAAYLHCRMGLYQFDFRVMAGGCGQAPVARQQRDVERLGPARYKRKVRQVGEGDTAARCTWQRDAEPTRWSWSAGPARWPGLLSGNRRCYDRWGLSAPLNGLSTPAPTPTTSRSLRVTSVRPLVNAVAASRPSMTGMGLTALIRPH